MYQTMITSCSTLSSFEFFDSSFSSPALSVDSQSRVLWFCCTGHYTSTIVHLLPWRRSASWAMWLLIRLCRFWGLSAWSNRNWFGLISNRDVMKSVYWKPLNIVWFHKWSKMIFKNHYQGLSIYFIPWNWNWYVLVYWKNVILNHIWL